MAKLTAAQIQAKYNKAYEVKSTWDTEYREVFEYCMPARDGYDKAIGPEKVTPEFQDRRENLYSSVGEQSANEFVNTMQEITFPPLTPWLALEAGPSFGDEEKKVKQDEELSKISKHANQYILNSSFDMAYSEFCYDLFAGTACILTLPGTPKEPLIYRAIPLREYCVEEGANGEVRAVYRKFTMKRELLSTQWKELKDKKETLSDSEKDQDVEIIESTWFDYDLDRYHYQVVDNGKAKLLVSRESKTNPFTVFRWNKCAGEPYGRGPGLTSINDIKTLNLIKYYSLRNLAFNTPPLLVQEDAMLDVDGLELTPWSLNVVPDTKTSIVPLQISTNYEIETYKTQELEMQIKKDTYGYTLPNDPGKMTAYETRQRKVDMQRGVATVAGRILSELQVPLVRRTLDVLSNTGVMGEGFKENFDVLNINGLIYKVNVVTPMMRILRNGEAQAILGSVGTLAEFDPSGALIQQTLKVNEMMAYYLELSGVPTQFINSPEETEKNQNDDAQGAQQAQDNAVQTDVAASNAKELGKAEAKKVENGL